MRRRMGPAQLEAAVPRALRSDQPEGGVNSVRTSLLRWRAAERSPSGCRRRERQERQCRRCPELQHRAALLAGLRRLFSVGCFCHSSWTSRRVRSRLREASKAGTPTGGSVGPSHVRTARAARFSFAVARNARTWPRAAGLTPPRAGWPPISLAHDRRATRPSRRQPRPQRRRARLTTRPLRACSSASKRPRALGRLNALRTRALRSDAQETPVPHRPSQRRSQSGCPASDSICGL